MSVRSRELQGWANLSHLIGARTHLLGVFALAKYLSSETFIQAACIVTSRLRIDAVVTLDRSNWELGLNVSIND